MEFLSCSCLAESYLHSGYSWQLRPWTDSCRTPLFDESLKKSAVARRFWNLAMRRSAGEAVDSLLLDEWTLAEYPLKERSSLSQDQVPITVHECGPFTPFRDESDRLQCSYQGDIDGQKEESIAEINTNGNVRGDSARSIRYDSEPTKTATELGGMITAWI
ncbi:hypothetical protein BDZ45DRAFT_746201 [Acephala macrosclerotiorum]|nr:hypothetical protein BDZ45DRAFT_746201 [Acephala macrosclerotiorum]